MAIEDEALVAVEALKRALRAEGKTYGEVAEHLAVSLPTVKRMLTRGVMPLSVFAKIAAFAGTTMGDLLADARDAGQRMTYFTVEQDRAFATRPALLLYFSLLVKGKEPRAIAKEHRLEPASTVKYLQALESIGLIEVAPHDRVTVLGTAPFAFSADSTSQRQNLLTLVRETIDGLLTKWSTPGTASGTLLVVKPMSLTSTRHGELARELGEVIMRHAVAAEREARSSTEPRRDLIAIAACDFATPRRVELPDW